MAEDPSVPRCPDCSAPVDIGAGLCFKCGQQLPQDFVDHWLELHPRGVFPLSEEFLKRLAPLLRSAS